MQRVPLLGTCGGFQHLIVEFLRNVVGVADADHEETSPDAPHLAVTALQCSLAGQVHRVRLVRGARARAIYDAEEVREPFYCNYGLNPEYRSLLEPHGLRVSGVGDGDEARVVELSGLRAAGAAGGRLIPCVDPGAGERRRTVCARRLVATRST
ncbi:MAG TPA: hypothetical protein VGG63_16885 [Steroidobacteraceae bacterium]